MRFQLRFRLPFSSDLGAILVAIWLEACNFQSLQLQFCDLGIYLSSVTMNAPGVCSNWFLAKRIFSQIFIFEPLDYFRGSCRRAFSPQNDRWWEKVHNRIIKEYPQQNSPK